MAKIMILCYNLDSTTFYKNKNNLIERFRNISSLQLTRNSGKQLKTSQFATYIQLISAFQFNSKQNLFADFGKCFFFFVLS